MGSLGRILHRSSPMAVRYLLDNWRRAAELGRGLIEQVRESKEEVDRYTTRYLELEATEYRKLPLILIPIPNPEP